jgi:hypothetical protein
MAEWRAAHERFWHPAEMRQVLGDPVFAVVDSDERAYVSRIYRAMSVLVPIGVACEKCPRCKLPSEL